MKFRDISVLYEFSTKHGERVRASAFYLKSEEEY